VKAELYSVDRCRRARRDRHVGIPWGASEKSLLSWCRGGVSDRLWVAAVFQCGWVLRMVAADGAAKIFPCRGLPQMLAADGC
jgi:hypothetical protein